MSFKVFKYSNKSFKFKVNWNQISESEFDNEYKNDWTSKNAEGCFRYRLKVEDSKILPGKYQFLAQLNLDRAINRRPAEDLRSITQPLDPNKFNFTKVKDREVMFKLCQEEAVDGSDDFVLINVSPLEFGHCLLLPKLHDCNPQIVTRWSLELAVSAVLLSHHPGFRAGFNSLCAYASVNHLHFHTYYLDRQMPLETIEVQHFFENCYVLVDFPSRGYAFQIRSAEEMNPVLNDLFKVISCLMEKEIPHNLYITRGKSFEGYRTGCMKERDCVRIYLWARTVTCGAKENDAFNPALCELFGHLVIKNKEAYDRLTEDYVTRILHQITHDDFLRTKDIVKECLSKSPK